MGRRPIISLQSDQNTKTTSNPDLSAVGLKPNLLVEGSSEWGKKEKRKDEPMQNSPKSLSSTSSLVTSLLLTNPISSAALLRDSEASMTSCASLSTLHRKRERAFVSERLLKAGQEGEEGDERAKSRRWTRACSRWNF